MHIRKLELHGGGKLKNPKLELHGGGKLKNPLKPGNLVRNSRKRPKAWPKHGIEKAKISVFTIVNISKCIASCIMSSASL